MTAAAPGSSGMIDVRGVRLQTTICGEGPTILFLRAGFWLCDEEEFVRELSRHARVIAPIHPGFGDAPAPAHFTSADDLAYLYLDLIDQLGLKNIILAGASFGGWVAAEMAIKNCSALAGLALIDSLGIRPGGRDDRDIADMFGLREVELIARAYHDPARGSHNLRALEDRDLLRRLRAREALARYGWQPYMHNPKLLGLLHRANVPARVIWGAQDAIASPAYGRAFAAALPNASFELVAEAGHLPHTEHPALVAEKIAALTRASQSATREPAAAAS